jgi:hypothetical protein
MVDGYSYTTAELDSVVNQFRDAGAHLDTANNGAVEMVDAGASSGIVGGALAALLMSSIDTAQTIEYTAGLVDVAKGSYGLIENNNKGVLDKQMQDGMKDYDNLMDGYNGPPS